MDWKDLGATLARTGAPIIGMALGGPLGGTIGGVLGNLVANALGVEATPEAVDTAIKTGDPTTVQAQLSSADAQAASKWDALVKIAQSQAEVDKVNIEQVNETIRSENAQSKPWWHWRNLIGYTVILWFMIPLPAFIRLTFQYDSGAALQLTGIITACVPLYGFMCGLLGYVAQDSTKLKSVAMIGEHPETITSSIAKAITGKKK